MRKNIPITHHGVKVFFFHLCLFSSFFFAFYHLISFFFEVFFLTADDQVSFHPLTHVPGLLFQFPLFSKPPGRPLRAVERRGDRQDAEGESPKTEGAPEGGTRARPRLRRRRGSGSRRDVEAADADAHAGAALPASAGGGCRGGRLRGRGGSCSVSGPGMMVHGRRE